MDNKNIKFSVIVPVYNVEEYLADCLDSVLEQTYDNFEIICIEDCSTDKSKEILYTYRERYHNITVIENSENRGLSATRNRGIESAIGEYIVFVDSDDVIEKDSLKKLNYCLEENDLDILYFNNDYLDSICNKGRFELERYNKIYNGKELFIEFINGNTKPVNAYTAVYKRSYLMANNLFFKEGIIHEDLLFFFDCILAAKQVKVLNKVLYLYRVRENSITTSYNEKSRDSLFIIVSELIFKWREYCGNSELDRAIEKYIYGYFLMYKRYENKYGKNDKHISLGIIYDFLYRIVCFNENIDIPISEFSDTTVLKMKNSRGVWIYGAGMIGTSVLHRLLELGVEIKGFIVSKQNNNEELEGYTIKKYETGIVKENEYVVVGVGPKYFKEIYNNIIKDIPNQVITVETPTLK